MEEKCILSLWVNLAPWRSQGLVMEPQCRGLVAQERTWSWMGPVPFLLGSLEDPQENRGGVERK